MMGSPDAFERQHTRIEPLDHLLGRGRRREMNDSAEPIVGDGNNGGIDGAADTLKNPIEARKVNGLAADLDEVSTTAVDAQCAAFDFTDIVGNEPPVNLWIG